MERCDFRRPSGRVTCFFFCFVVMIIMIVMMVLDTTGVRKEWSVVHWNPPYQNVSCADEVMPRMLPYQNFSCADQQTPTNIVFIKIHKAASTTISNLLARYAMNHDLNIALPEQKPGGGLFHCFGPFQEDRVLPLAAGQQYHVLFNHMIYNRTALERVMPKNAMYIAIMREPFDRLIAGIYYFNVIQPPAKNNTNNDAFKKLFERKNRMKMEKNFRIFNTILWDTGMPVSLQGNMEAVKRHLQQLDRELDLMLVREHLHESLVLLKRRACLDLKDIIIAKTNTRKNYKIHNFTQQDKTMLKEWQRGDHIAYDHFYAKFWAEIHKEGSSFQAELEHFNNITMQVNEFCSTNSSQWDTLVVRKSPWNQRFTLNKCDCLLMTSEEKVFQEKLLNRAKDRRKKAGYVETRKKIRKWTPDC